MRAWTPPRYLAHVPEDDIRTALTNYDEQRWKTADLMAALQITRAQALRLLRDSKYEHLRPSTLSVNLRRGRPFKEYPFIEEAEDQVLQSVCEAWMNGDSITKISKTLNLAPDEIKCFLLGKCRPEFARPADFLAPPRRRLSQRRKEKTELVKQVLSEFEQGLLQKRDLPERLGMTRQAVDYLLRGVTYPHLRLTDQPKD